MGSIQRAMTPALQLFLLLTVGQIMMTGSDPADPLDELHVHLHLQDEDHIHEEDQTNNKKSPNKKLGGQADDYSNPITTEWPAPNSKEEKNSKESNGSNDSGNEEKAKSNKWLFPIWRPRWMPPGDK